MTRARILAFPGSFVTNLTFSRDPAGKWSDCDARECAHFGRRRNSRQVRIRWKSLLEFDLFLPQSAGGVGDEDAGDDNGQDGARLPQGHRPLQP